MQESSTAKTFRRPLQNTIIKPSVHPAAQPARFQVKMLRHPKHVYLHWLPGRQTKRSGLSGCAPRCLRSLRLLCTQQTVTILHPSKRGPPAGSRCTRWLPANWLRSTERENQSPIQSVTLYSFETSSNYWCHTSKWKKELIKTSCNS